jgi:dolichyl-phosphate-mannose-protein mannosyltransferase
MQAANARARTPLDWRLVAALLTSLLLLGLRLDLARVVGFGDAEALYVVYSLHPQPGYLDHPGLVGWIAGLLGSRGPPSPLRVHVFTAILATLVPWLGVLTARVLGSERGRLLHVYFALALLPELAIGLFALTPDLPLAIAWLGTLAAAAYALTRPAGDLRVLLAYLAVGAGAAVACLAKASGALLALGVFACALRPSELRRWRTLGPWAALLVFGIVGEPLLSWEVEQGFPMLRHRLITTPGEAGPSLLTLARLLTGQLLYVTPPFLVGAWLVARDLFRKEHGGARERLLQLTALSAFVPLVLLCLYSPVAEPHWLGPAYLGLALYVGRSHAVQRWLRLCCCIVGLAMVTLGWAWVRTDLPVRVGDLLGGYEPRYDPSNDLYAWKSGGALLEDAVQQARKRTGRTPTVVGPHWVVCAQAELALRGEVPVGCDSPIDDDYDRWLPRQRWAGAATILFVSDSRFDAGTPFTLSEHELVSRHEVEVRRGGRLVRTISVLELDRSSAHAGLAAPVR